MKNVRHNEQLGNPIMLGVVFVHVVHMWRVKQPETEIRRFSTILISDSFLGGAHNFPSASSSRTRFCPKSASGRRFELCQGTLCPGNIVNVALAREDSRVHWVRVRVRVRVRV